MDGAKDDMYVDKETRDIYKEIDDPYNIDDIYVDKETRDIYKEIDDQYDEKERDLRHQATRRNSQEGGQMVNKLSTPRRTGSSDFRESFKSDRKFYNKRQLKPRTEEIALKDYVPQMVEAFRSLIEESVRVSEVLPYLPFLDDKEEIQEKEISSPKQATRLLLDRLIASEELGKWTTFLDALKTVGYQYITNILLGNTELDLSLHKNLLKIFIPEIINNVEPTELIYHLYSRDVISVTDKEEIECELRNRGASAASLKLLDRIPRRIENWYGEFVDALRACGFDFVANRINLPEVQQAYIEESVCPAPSRHMFGHKKTLGVKTSYEYEPMSNTSMNDSGVEYSDTVLTSNTSIPNDATEQWNTDVKTVISSDFTRKTLIEYEARYHCDTDVKTALGSELTQQKKIFENRATDQSDMGVKAVIGGNYKKTSKLTKPMAGYAFTEGYTRGGGSDKTKPKILSAAGAYITPTYVPHDPTKRGTVAPPLPPRPPAMNVEPTMSTDSTTKKLQKTLSIRTSTLQEFLDQKKRLINEIEDMRIKRKIKRDIKFLQTLQDCSIDSSDEDDVSIISINQEMYPKIMRLAAHGGERHDQVIQVDLEDIIKDLHEATELETVNIASETGESRGNVKHIKTDIKEQRNNQGREVTYDKIENEAEEDKIIEAKVVEKRLAAQTEANDCSAKVSCDKSLQETDKMANLDQAALAWQLDNISLKDFLQHFIQNESGDRKMTTERNDISKDFDIDSKDLMDVLMYALRNSAKGTTAPNKPTVVSGDVDEEEESHIVGVYLPQGNSGSNLPNAHVTDMQCVDSGVNSSPLSCMYFGAPADYN